MSISVWIDSMAHRLVIGCIVEQARHLFDDPVVIRSDQPDRSGFQSFRPLRGIAHYQDRLTQRRRFFLYSAAIGQDNTASFHQTNEIEVLQRFRKKHIRQSAFRPEHLSYGSSHIGIQMHGIYKIDTGIRKG